MSKNLLEMQMDLCCAHLISSLFRLHKAHLATGEKSIRKESTGATGVEFRKLATQRVSFVELCDTSPCSVNFSSAYKLHFTATLKGWSLVLHVGDVRTNLVVIMGLLCMLGKLTRNLHIQPYQLFVVPQIKLLPNNV